MTNELNLFQQAFALSLRAGSLFTLNGDRPDTKSNMEKALLQDLNDFVKKNGAYLGTIPNSEDPSWSIVWGPAVFSLTGFGDNVVYVARKDISPPVYIVAVAGTNQYSQFAKSDEDGQVETTTTWTNAFTTDLVGSPLLTGYSNPVSDFGNPCLSAGTALGVRCLLRTIPDSDTNPSDPSPKRLAEYLAGVADRNSATLIIAGHSLAGALAPILALAMFNPNGGPLAHAGWRDVRVLPTAGATPGNADLSKSFASVFPMIPATLTDDPNPPNPPNDVHWNQNIGTLNDIVPLAWVPTSHDNIRGLDKISELYTQLKWGKEGPKNKKILAEMVKIFQKKATTGGDSMPFGRDRTINNPPAGPYTPLPSIACTVDEIDASATISEFPKDYVAHWKKQHIDGYIKLFGVHPLYPNAEENKKMGGLVATLFEHVVTEKD